MFQPVTAPGDRRYAESFDGALQSVHHSGDGTVADDVESCRDTGLGTGEQMRRDRVDIQLAVPGSPRLVGIGLA